MGDIIICKTCPYFHPVKGEEPECRRMPPKILYKVDNEEFEGERYPGVACFSIWPTVQKNDFCGHHPKFRIRRAKENKDEMLGVVKEYFEWYKNYIKERDKNDDDFLKSHQYTNSFMGPPWCEMCKYGINKEVDSMVEGIRVRTWVCSKDLEISLSGGYGCQEFRVSKITIDKINEERKGN